MRLNANGANAAHGPTMITMSPTASLVNATMGAHAQEALPMESGLATISVFLLFALGILGKNQLP